MTMEIFFYSLPFIACGAFYSIYKLFLYFSKKYMEGMIENKFSQDLERLKADLENVKLYNSHELGVLSALRINSHKKEQEVLPKSWEQIMKVKKTLITAINTFRGHQNFTELNNNEIKKFMDNNNFTDTERDYLNNATDFNIAYNQVMDTREYSEYVASVSNFIEYFNDNVIFLSSHIKENFLNLQEHFEYFKFQLNSRFRSDSEMTDLKIEARDKFTKETSPLIEEIENVIKKELFPDSKDQP